MCHVVGMLAIVAAELWESVLALGNHLIHTCNCNCVPINLRGGASEGTLKGGGCMGVEFKYQHSFSRVTRPTFKEESFTYVSSDVAMQPLTRDFSCSVFLNL